LLAIQAFCPDLVTTEERIGPDGKNGEIRTGYVRVSLVLASFGAEMGSGGPVLQAYRLARYLLLALNQY
jgi:hypothetical protein